MLISKYTKIPVEVEAVEVKLEDFPNIAAWVDGRVAEYFKYKESNPTKCIEYTTMQGINTAQIGDYIIKEGNVFYTVTDERFKYMFKEI